MKLGLIVGYWPSSGPPADAADQIAAAEELGFDSVWTSEAYGSDCFTPLAWWGSQTERVKLGTAITQISARTPASTAMTAITLDHLSGGRLILGLGVSGPQVVEGWYGQDYAKPLARTREYVEIVRRIVAREEPVAFAGEHYAMPLPGGTGLGKPLKSIVRPLRTDIPIYLGAEGPKNVALGRRDRRRLAADVLLAQGRRRLPGGARRGLRPARGPPHGRRLRGRVRGAGHPGRRRRGLRRPAAPEPGAVHRRHGRPRPQLPQGRVRPARLRGRVREDPGGVPRPAARPTPPAAVPTAMVEDVYLVGPPDKIRDDSRALARDLRHRPTAGGGGPGPLLLDARMRRALSSRS